MIKNLILKIIGKKVGEELTVSKAKLTALVFVLVTAVQTLGPVFGHPVVIPDWVFKFLEGCGLWAIRDAIQS